MRNQHKKDSTGSTWKRQTRNWIKPPQRINTTAKSQQAPLKWFPSAAQRRKLKGTFGSAYALISPRPLETFAACLPAAYDEKSEDGDVGVGSVTLVKTQANNYHSCLFNNLHRLG